MTSQTPIARPYTNADVERLRGSVAVEHTLARLGAERLRRLLLEEERVAALGALSGGQAVQMVKAGLQAIYLSGWQVAAEVHRRSLDRAGRKACVGDGSHAVWALFAFHLVAAGFIPILDFVHLLTYLYAAAGAVRGKGTAAAWTLYERWLRWAWAGDVQSLLAGLREAVRHVGEPPDSAAADDPRQLVADALSYVTNNQERMEYPRYRCLGLPIVSAAVESTIKQVNRRIKGSEKFWLTGGAEAVLQVQSAYLSQDERAQRLWAKPRPYARSVGPKRLQQAA